MKQLRGIELKRFLRAHKERRQEIILVLENIQYARNVASIFRTADAAGVSKIILGGISHKPPFGKDLRKASRSKEMSVPWEYHEHLGKSINKYKKQGYSIIGVEITDESVNYEKFDFPEKVVIVLGSEVYGITRKTIERLDHTVFIPMKGKGASLNVGIAGAIILFGMG